MKWTFATMIFFIQMETVLSKEWNKKFFPKAFILDMDGVLRRGFESINGANEYIQWVQKNNIPTLILTNECRYTKDRLRTDLAKLGVKIPKNIIIYTAAMAMRDFFLDYINLDIPTYCYIIGERGLKEHMKEIKNPNLVFTDKLPSTNQKARNIYLIFGSVNNIKMRDLENASHWIKAGAKTLISSPDTAHPSSKGETLIGMPGHMVHMLKKISPTDTYNTGKPNPFVAKKALQKLQNISPKLSSKDILFVGDSMDTDIRIAFENDMKSALVLSGNTKKEMWKKSVFQPNYIFDSIKDLHRFFKDKKKTIQLSHLLQSH